LRPWFLPDGRHFLYVTRGGKPAIYVATLDGPERKRLVNTGQAGAYAPPSPGARLGHLLFLRESTLMAQPMDPGKLELTGEPFPVAEQVGFSLAMGFFSVSASGVLAYRAGALAGSGELVWFDREGRNLGTVGSAGALNGDLALSPDGTRVALDMVDTSGTRDVWVTDVARGIPTRFTFSSAQDIGPVWAPDGRRLAFGSDRANANVLDIYIKDSRGAGEEEMLLKGGRPTHWSADGRYLLYEHSEAQTRMDLWVAPLTTGDRKPFPYLATPFDERQGQFSPDGHWIAYASDEGSPSQYQVFVQSFPTGAGKFQVSTGAGGAQPRWRRDGKEIFYLSADGKLMAVGVETSPAFQPGAPRALFDPRTMGIALVPWMNYDVSPDGKRFLASSTATGENAASAPITVVLNWNAEQKR
jgi:Tol biopolymer transport system component